MTVNRSLQLCQFTLEIAQFHSIVNNPISSITAANTNNTNIHLNIPNKSASFSKASYEYITEQTQVANGILGGKAMHDSHYFREKSLDMITHYQVKSTMENYDPSILLRYLNL